jgi:phage anti-repressor protein
MQTVTYDPRPLQLTSNGINIPFHPRTVEPETIHTIDGRDIAQVLHIKEDYAPWIQRQVERLYLIEKKDFWVFSVHQENPKGGRPSKEYYFTIDSAKHIAMVSHTPMGYHIREYFLACEKELQRLRETEVLRTAFLAPLYDTTTPSLYPPDRWALAADGRTGFWLDARTERYVHRWHAWCQEAAVVPARGAVCIHTALEPWGWPPT